MNKQSGITVEIMGRAYQIKCSESEALSLQRAAQFLEEKMINARDVGKVISIDRIAVIAALNIAHQFLNLENQSKNQVTNIQQHLLDLQSKVETALSKHQQMELSSAE